MNSVRQMKMIKSKIAIRIEGDQKRNALLAWVDLVLRRSSWWKEHPRHEQQCRPQAVIFTQVRAALLDLRAKRDR